MFRSPRTRLLHSPASSPGWNPAMPLAPACPRPVASPGRRAGLAHGRRREEEKASRKKRRSQPGLQRLLCPRQRRLAQGQHDRRRLRHESALGQLGATRAAAADRPAQRRHAGRRAASPSCSGISGPAGWTRPRSNATAPTRSRRCSRASMRSAAARTCRRRSRRCTRSASRSLFNFGADVDLADLGRHIGYFSQGGLGLPDPAYYTRTDADTRALLGRYTDYVSKILALTGSKPEQLQADTQAVLDLETRIAQASQAAGALRDPRAQLRAGRRRADLGKQYRHLQLGDFLKAQGVSDDSVSLANPQLFAQLDALVGGLKPAQWKTYLRYHVGAAMAPYLSKAVARRRLRLPRRRAARRDRAAAAPAAGAGRDQPRRRADARSRIRRPLPARYDACARRPKSPPRCAMRSAAASTATPG